MKGNELRIGNYIGILHPGVETKCSIHHIREILNGETMYKPIPLTEEWLLRFGFLKINKNGDYKKDCYTCMIRKYHITFSNNHGYITNIEYVHQLQNLYFALTGEELEIK